MFFAVFAMLVNDRSVSQCKFGQPSASARDAVSRPDVGLTQHALVIGGSNKDASKEIISSIF